MARRRNSRRYRGGAGSPDPSSYSDGASYGVAVNGNTNSQYDRTFMGTGPAIYQGVQGQMTGGKRSRRSRRGGFLGAMGSVVNQAIVPAAILGMQQTYRKKHYGGRKSRRNSRRRR
jgi:hypothetical protein